MKILQIDNGQGLFYAKNEKSYISIDKIDKNSLLDLLNEYLSGEVEMDSPNDVEIQNKAQKLIYCSVYEKFISLNDNKTQFKDAAERTYLAEIREYKETSD